MSDLTDRLRRWAIATDAVPASDLMDEAANEIDRLRLTDAERQAVERASNALFGVEEWDPDESEKDQEALAALRSLLERMGWSP